MPNIAAVLREEIMRLARKEIRAQTGSALKAVSQLRHSNVALKREAADLQRRMKRLERATTKPAKVSSDEQTTRLRFNAKGLATHRSKLGLSAADYGKLVGVTGQTIYKWEQGGAKPRASQLAALAPIRGMGKRAALAKLEETGSSAE